MVSEHRFLICPKKATFLEISEHNTRIVGKILRRPSSPAGDHTTRIIDACSVHWRKNLRHSTIHMSSRAYLSLEALPHVSATNFLLLVRLQLTKLLKHLPPLFETYNSEFQRILCPTTLFFLAFVLFSLFSSRSEGVLWIVEPSSMPVQCFSWKCGHFSCKILFFWSFLNFQRLVRVRYASMTNTKPSRGVACHYCHNLGHVRHNCRKLQNKNRKFRSVHYQKSFKPASTSITTLA